MDLLDLIKNGKLDQAKSKVYEKLSEFANSSLDQKKIRIAGSYFGQQVNEASYDRNLDPNKPIIVSGVRGANSRSFKKKFRNAAAYDKWSDSPEADDYEIRSVTNEETLDELSKDLVGRYAEKANRRSELARVLSSKKRDDLENYQRKRNAGVGNAIKKLTGKANVSATEETIDE